MRIVEESRMNKDLEINYYYYYDDEESQEFVVFVGLQKGTSSA